MTRSAPGAAEARLGPAWAALVSGLREELAALDPKADLRCEIEMHGLPRLRARVSPELRPQATRLLKENEGRLIECCELCGDAGRVYGGPILTIRCSECAGL